MGRNTFVLSKNEGIEKPPGDISWYQINGRVGKPEYEKISSNNSSGIVASFGMQFGVKVKMIAEGPSAWLATAVY